MDIKTIAVKIDKLIQQEKMICKDIDYRVFIGAQSSQLIDQYRSILDYRLIYPKYLKRSISVLGYHNNEVIANCTFYIMDSDTCNDVFFWYKDTNKVLYKKYLKDIIDLNNQLICTCAFGRITTDSLYLKKKFIEMYMKFSNVFINKNIMCYIEGTGTYQFDILDINTINNLALNIDIDESVLGQICKQSKPVMKLAKKLGLNEIKNYYHSYTLGPIYCTDNFHLEITSRK